MQRLELREDCHLKALPSFPHHTWPQFSAISLVMALFWDQAIHPNSFRHYGKGQGFSLNLLGLDCFELEVIHIPQSCFGVAHFAPLQCLCSLLPLLCLVTNFQQLFLESLQSKALTGLLASSLILYNLSENHNQNGKKKKNPRLQHTSA